MQLYVDSGTMDEKLKVNVKPLDKNHQTQKFQRMGDTNAFVSEHTSVQIHGKILQLTNMVTGGLHKCVQGELGELKKKIEEFEEKYSEAEKESKTRLKEAEEAQLKAMLLQETIERQSTKNWS